MKGEIEKLSPELRKVLSDFSEMDSYSFVKSVAIRLDRLTAERDNARGNIKGGSDRPVDWPISHYNGKHTPVKMRNGETAYIFTRTDTMLLGYREDDPDCAEGWALNGSAMGAGLSPYDLLPLAPEPVYAWAVWGDRGTTPYPLLFKKYTTVRSWLDDAGGDSYAVKFEVPRSCGNAG